MADLTVTLTGSELALYPPPTGFAYTTGSLNARIFGGAYVSTGNTTAAVIYLTPPATIASADIVLHQVGSDALGPCWAAPNGNGYYVLVRNFDIRVFRATATNTGLTVLSGGTYTGAVAINDRIRITVNKSTGQIEVRQNGTLRLTVTDTTHIAEDLRLGWFSRGSRVASFTAYDVAVYTIDTLTSPLVPGEPFSGTVSNSFINGAATFSVSGINVELTLSSGAFSGETPMLDDGDTWPRLPSSGTTITLTQGANVAAIARNISLPTGYETLRVGDDPAGAPANFLMVIDNDAQYLGNHLSLDETKTWYFPTSDALWVDRDSGVGSDVVPRTDVHYEQDAATGLITAHNVTLTPSGSIIVDAEITSVGTVRVGGTTPVTVANFTDAVNAGTLDGVALTAASNTSITVPGLVDGENVPRPGTRELDLTDGSGTASVDVPVLAPLGWSSYVITGDFVEAINGVGADYLPGTWAVTDFILSPNAPSSGKTTTVTDAGVVTNNVGTQELFLVDAATGLATAFDVVTTAGAGEIGTGSATEPTMQVIRMETLRMVGL